MPDDVSRGEICGFFVPFDLTVEDLHADSSYTQDQSVPGTPQSPDGAALHLQASGEQGSDTYVLHTRRAGDVRPAGAGQTWKKKTDAADRERGWDPPIALHHWEALRWINLDCRTPHARRLPSGEAVNVSFDVITTGSAYQVTFRRVNHDGSVFSTAIYTQSSEPSAAVETSLHPALAVLDDGSMILGHLLEDAAGNEAQWALYRSTDKGDTWTTVSRFTLEAPINTDTNTANDGYKVRRARMAAAGRHVSLLFWTQPYKTGLSHYNAYHQYSAKAEGLRFRLVELASADTAGSPPVATADPIQFGWPDLISYRGAFLLHYLRQTDLVRQVVLPDADARISQQPDYSLPNPSTYNYAEYNTNVFGAGDYALWAGPSGLLYSSCRDFTGSTNLARALLFRSEDYGQTWSQWSDQRVSDNETWWKAGNKNNVPVNYCATAGNGRSYIFGNHGVVLDNEDNPVDATAATYANSLSMWALGGYITHCMPAESEFGFDIRRVGWRQCGIPSDLPGNTTEWSRTASGTYNESIAVGGRLTTTTASGAVLYYKQTGIISTDDEGISVLFDARQVSGGSVSSLLSGFVIYQRPSVAVNREIQVRFQASPARVAVVDNGGASPSTLYDETIDWSTMKRFRVEVRGGRVQVWLGEADGHSDQDDVQIVDAAINSAAGSSGSEIRFGPAHSASLAETHWRLRAATFGDQAGERTLPIVNPDDLWARDYAGVDGDTFIDAGLHVRAVSGPGREGDSYEIPPRSPWPARRLFWPSSTSPRQLWRSEAGGGGTADAQTFVWSLTASGQDMILPPMIGFHYAGFRCLGSVLWSRYVSAGYTTPTTITLGYTFDATRQGDTLIPTSGGSSGPFFDLDECVGWYLDLGGGVFREIVSNEDGVLANNSGSKRVTFKVAADSGDPTSISGCRLYPPDGTILIPIASGTNAARLRLTLPAQDTPDDKWLGGCIWPGQFITAGRRWEYGARYTLEPGSIREETQDRIGYARELAPARLAFELGWTGLLQDKQTKGDATAPNYRTLYTGSSYPAGIPHAAAQTLEGVFRRAKGPTRPLVACTLARPSTTDPIVLHRRRDAIRGVAVGAYTRRRVLKDGWRGEAVPFAELL